MAEGFPIPLELISDFNVDLLGRFLENLAAEPKCAVRTPGFGQVYQTLTAPASQQAREGGAVLWTRAEGVLPAFARAVAFEPVDHDDVLADVDRFCDLLLSYAQGCRILVVTSWVLPLGNRGYGPLDFRPGLGLAHLLARANLRLAEKLGKAANVFMLDAERWCRVANAHSPKMWFAAKVPFAPSVFETAALDIKALLRGVSGQTRKLLVLDLDDTLWGGVVGETGWQGVRLGGHDHVGEAFLAFQQAVKGLIRRGIQVAIASKNDEAVALDAIDYHPEMQLRRSDIACWRINWADKATNIAAIVKELNLGLSAVVFVDDNPAERGRVREALPEVLVPEWPVDPAAYVQALEQLRCFDMPAISAEDRMRASMYAAERERRQSEAAIESPEDWIRTLGVRVRASLLSPFDLPRSGQLFNKTNQLNLSTRRLTETELWDWASAPDHVVWTAKVSDRFGELGLTGLVSIEMAGVQARIVDFILSCRAMGRRVEETLLHLAVSHAMRNGAKRVELCYLPTERNRPTLDFLLRSGLRQEGNLFVWESGQDYPCPDAVALDLAEDEKA